MKFNTFCIVAGSEACTGGCKWCVAAMTTARSIHKGKAKPIDERVFKMACQMAQQSGLDTARITGKGEPTLFPDQITQILTELKPYGFTFVEMQTHGRHLADEDFVSHDDMKAWADLGLTHVCISVVSYKPERNQEHYFGYNKSYSAYYDMAALISKLHKLRINVRLTCIMQKGDIDSSAELVKFMQWAKDVKATRSPSCRSTSRSIASAIRRSSMPPWRRCSPTTSSKTCAATSKPTACPSARFRGAPRCSTWRGRISASTCVSPKAPNATTAGS